MTGEAEFFLEGISVVIHVKLNTSEEIALLVQLKAELPALRPQRL